MTGNSGRGLVLQERDRHLLAEIGIMRVVDRDAARHVAPFGSVSRANARLLALLRAGLLRRFFVGTACGGRKALYLLSSSGARLVSAKSTGPRRGRDELVVADTFLAHQSAVNDLYCQFKYGAGAAHGIAFRRWCTFSSPLAPAAPVIPDGYVECERQEKPFAAFLEADLGHERLAVWQAKVRHYLRYAVSGHFAERFGAAQFLVLAVANSPGRMESLRGATAKLTDKIFRFATFEAIRRESVWAPIWRKPQGDEPVPLIPNP